jgi:hypothetical protein
MGETEFFVILGRCVRRDGKFNDPIVMSLNQLIKKKIAF